jgi:hypothetical protein
VTLGIKSSGKMLHADAERIYLTSVQGNLFVLAQDRGSNFPLLQIISDRGFMSGVTGDTDNLYVTIDGDLKVYRKTTPLQLVRTEEVAAFQLGGPEVVGNDLYVSRVLTLGPPMASTFS